VQDIQNFLPGCHAITIRQRPFQIQVSIPSEIKPYRLCTMPCRELSSRLTLVTTPPTTLLATVCNLRAYQGLRFLGRFRTFLSGSLSG
jgi:hypothetical protein